MKSKNIKLFAAAALALLVIIVLAQNTGPITVRFLFWHIRMSQVLFIPLLLGTGFLIGYIAATWRKSRYI